MKLKLKSYYIFQSTPASSINHR